MDFTEKIIRIFFIAKTFFSLLTNVNFWLFSIVYEIITKLAEQYIKIIIISLFIKL